MLTTLGAKVLFKIPSPHPITLITTHKKTHHEKMEIDKSVQEQT